MAYKPKCPIMVALFLAFAWLQTAYAFLGASLASRLHSLHSPPIKQLVDENEESSTSMDAMVASRTMPSVAVRRRPLTPNLSGLHPHSPPWRTSIAPNRDLSYMNMFSHQLDVLRDRDFRSLPIEDRFAYQTSPVKPARIASVCYEGERFRKVRMTYFDAGEQVQVSISR